MNDYKEVRTLLLHDEKKFFTLTAEDFTLNGYTEIVEGYKIYAKVNESNSLEFLTVTAPDKKYKQFFINKYYYNGTFSILWDELFDNEDTDETLEELLDRVMGRDNESKWDYTQPSNAQWSSVLVKKCFLSFSNDEQTQVQWQGVIEDRLDEKHFVVQFFSWIDGGYTNKRIVTIDEMKNWKFYLDDEDMRRAYEHSIK